MGDLPPTLEGPRTVVAAPTVADITREAVQAATREVVRTPVVATLNDLEVVLALTVEATQVATRKDRVATRGDILDREVDRRVAHPPDTALVEATQAVTADGTVPIRLALQVAVAMAKIEPSTVEAVALLELFPITPDHVQTTAKHRMVKVVVAIRAAGTADIQMVDERLAVAPRHRARA